MSWRASLVLLVRMKRSEQSLRQVSLFISVTSEVLIFLAGLLITWTLSQAVCSSRGVRRWFVKINHTRITQASGNKSASREAFLLVLQLIEQSQPKVSFKAVSWCTRCVCYLFIRPWSRAITEVIRHRLFE